MDGISAVNRLRQKAFDRLMHRAIYVGNPNLNLKGTHHTGLIMQGPGIFVRYKDGVPVADAVVKNGKVVHCSRYPYGDVFCHTRGRGSAPDDSFKDTIATINGTLNLIV